MIVFKNMTPELETDFHAWLLYQTDKYPTRGSIQVYWDLGILINAKDIK